MKIVLCSSATFYEDVNRLADELTRMGHEAVVPATARRMKASGNYSVKDHKSWYRNKADFTTKGKLIDQHFKEVADGDAVLMVNNEKRGIKGYIGANAAMEMAVAHYLGKKIFVLNEVAPENFVYEEVHGMGATILNGDLSAINSTP